MGMAVAACGGGTGQAQDEGPTSAPTAAAATATEAATSEAPAGPEEVAEAGGNLEVTMTDGGFAGTLPDRVPAGTALTMHNDADSEEFHTLLVVRLDAGDARTAEDLMALGIDTSTTIGHGYHSLEGLGGTAVGTLSAPPGGVGRQWEDGASRLVLDEPGRYVVFDTFPVGTGIDEAIEAENAGDFSGLGEGPFHHQGGELAVVEVGDGDVTASGAEQPFDEPFFYGDFEEGVLLFAGARVEDFCTDTRPSATAEVTEGPDGTIIRLPEVVWPIHLYESSLGAPELIGETCGALAEDEGAAVPVPFAVGEGRVTATITVRPDGSEHVVNRTVGTASSDDGTTWEVEGWADLEIVDGAPVGDPADFQGLTVSKEG